MILVDNEKIEAEWVTIIRADPGWFLATFINGGNDGAESWDDSFAPLDPIIAWEIRRSRRRYYKRTETFITHDVIPLTLEGSETESMSNPTAIKRPDGRYEIPCEASFKSESGALEYFKKQRDVEREREQEKKEQAHDRALSKDDGAA